MTHQIPSHADTKAVTEALAELHGMPTRKVRSSATREAKSCGERSSVLAAVIATILSQNTTNKNSQAAMASLMQRFDGDFAAMLEAGPGAIAEAIRCGGLSNVKGRRIHALMADIEGRHGALSLEHLRGLDDDAATQALMHYEGIGPKTASCVLLFALERPSFAVDTHVLRICKKLGWVGAKCSREQAFHILDAAIPDAHKYALHVLMVYHGKCCPECAPQGRSQRPAEGPCPLSAIASGKVPARRTRKPRARGVVTGARAVATSRHGSNSSPASP